MTTTSRAHSFNAAAAAYAANRPSYPPALLDAVEELAGRPLAGARVADVGAGTGIASALLHERGARIVAVEPGDGMAEQFRRTLPGVPVVRGDGNNLPLADASADFITYAQAWHWTDPARSAPEAMRVLRPGGALALWWNIADHGVQWIADQKNRIERFFGGSDIVLGAHGTAARTLQTGGLDFADRTVHWTREVSIDTHLANLASHSVFLVAGEEATREFADQERTVLRDLFPQGMVSEAYAVDLCVAIR
ncbi:class I SAM-dependent methyltransferase [Streptomyces sp. NPDC090052]|uniref:class I SAM-dependent methyltransferase n=1 Tax=unclassified Streptomyces TaxID=2593676 RepID=UPI002255909A|nr:MULTISPECIES: class I SAM-dependent methyltransferase [unclassified Streptomyces]MCX4724752.1 class I SAM-dependent methyltransferase [Streptomyces sp. NBC_01306]WSX68112.1 class I SAM-dependent methyltransferase [Streptomyces sp. NBC_00932]